MEKLKVTKNGYSVTMFDMFILDGSQEEHETKADRESGVALQVSASIITNFVVNNTLYSNTHRKNQLSHWR